MLWSVVMQVLSTILELLQIGRLSDQEKYLEILVLRKQLAMMEQQLDQLMRLSRAERLTLAVITAKLKAVTGRSINQLRDVIRIVQPETALRWHREMVRRKWTQQQKNTGGRPRTPPNAVWVNQQARQMVWDLEGRDPAIRFLIRDNDKKFTQVFDTIFRSEGIRVVAQ